MLDTVSAESLNEKRPKIARDLPRSLYLETTNRCDSKCETCPRTFLTKEPQRDLKLDELKKIVDQFAILERVVLHGVGEPLLNPELFDMIAYLKAKGTHVLFNSDAISLTPKRTRKLIDSGLDEFRVSMDSATPATYRMVRGVDQFDRVVKNLADIRLQQRELGIETPRLSIWFVAMKPNVHELPDFVRLAHSLGLPEVYMQRLVTTTAGRQGLGMAVDENSMYGDALEAQQRALIEESEVLAREFGIAFHASGMSDPLASLRPDQHKRHWATCNRPWSVSYVTANGNVLPCNISACTAKDYPGTILGNAFEQDFATIWNGGRYQNLREGFESDVAPDPCENCGLKWSI